ncbi:hypothetical protein DPMN_192151 [Dreissena polymorpha]|uniref:Uncharacterized protein n=1 Tax=Dreissena polymorpha TaxID=45954 RepID=A0A9D3Y0A5_DREPO|nr:hypothetical protein DPMN_192151 [Dreissena polymorpha]
MAASDAVYHKNCLTALYNQYRKFESAQNLLGTSHTDIAPENIAFAELKDYIDQFQNVSVHTKHIFKLSNLVKLYHDRILSLGGTAPKLINNTNLKEKILRTIPSLEANKSNYEVVLSFKKDIGDALLCASSINHDNEAVTLLRAASIVRKDLFSKKYEFKDSLIDA